MSLRQKVIGKIARRFSALNKPINLPIGGRIDRWIPVFDGQVNYNPGREGFLHEVLRQIRENHRSPLLLDVGANIGQTISNFCNIIPGCRIISFEPNPNCCAYLIHFINSNAALNVTLFSGALGSSQGLVSLKRMRNDDLYSQRASTAVKGRATWHEREICKVPQTTLDSVQDTTSFDGLTLIKIDVEGAEIDILRGGMNVLRRYKPIIAFEVLPAFLFVEREDLPDTVVDERQANASAIYDLLTELGYVVSQNKDGTFTKVGAINVRDIRTVEQTAFIARHPTGI